MPERGHLKTGSTGEEGPRHGDERVLDVGSDGKGIRQKYCVGCGEWWAAAWWEQHHRYHNR